MTPERWAKVDRVWHAVLARHEEQRAAVIAELCAGDDPLRRDVESLLAHRANASDAGFLSGEALPEAALAGHQLTIGSRWGQHQIQALIGVGGMGKVYRSHDTTLGRDVAIKIVPDLWLTDTERRARFDREARLLAALNHPNIGAIYGIEESGGIRGLVLELVEGETLADRIGRGPIPVDAALALAFQVAEALEAAHEKGIIHRDLKPANIRITPQGRVKVLDFGLAKTQAPEDARTDRSQASTLASTELDQGVIAGTPAYMSPEQARGDPIDRTSDNWAFGCVLFEMLTGAQAFAGRTISDVIEEILQADPRWQDLPHGTPLPVRLLLRRCLHKDPRRRLQFIGDARVEIDQLLNDAPAAVAEATSVAGRPRHSWAWIFAVVALLVLTSISTALYLRPRASPPDVIRFEIPTQANRIAVSPDGRQIAYSSTPPGSNRPATWIRPMNSLSVRLLPGTEGVGQMAWSPDGRFMAFSAEPERQFEKPKLKKVDVTSGAVLALADIGPYLSARPTWNGDGVIVFESDRRVLQRVSAAGGASTDVTALDVSIGEMAHMWPSFLPDGRHFLYQARSQAAGSERRTIYIGSLDGHTRVRLMDSASMAVYAPPGYILFIDGGTLMARPFDPKGLAITGDAVIVADDVLWVEGTGRAVFDVSSEGTLIYRNVNARWSRPFAWKDRDGNTLGTACAAAPNRSAWNLAPDGRTVALVLDPPIDLWLCDFERDLPTRLTSDPYRDNNVVWSPDGSRLVFQSARSQGQSAIYEKASNGATPERVLLPGEPGVFSAPLDWSRDGKWIVFSKERGQSAAASGKQAGTRDLWVLPLGGDAKPFPYLSSALDETQAALSPDARFLAYASNEAGSRYEIIVQPFPDASAGKWWISTGGGCCPRWKRDGSELYYVNADRRIVAVAVQTAPTFKIGRALPLGLSLRVNSIATMHTEWPYDVDANGRFLVAGGVVPADDSVSRSIMVVVNWTSILKR